jgi:hypothetical protein|tara:strand:+ start:671 stop:1249 length:579 start_codon:yes stop_codon:yes gene_type:complete
MKLNEVLLIGGALLAALVLSKGGAVSSVLQNFTVPLLSNENQNQKEITTVIVKPPQFTQIDITQQLRNISSSELEKNLAPLQNQLSQTQKYISDQEKIINKRYGRGQAGAFLYPSDVQNIQNKYGIITNENTIQYFENNPEIRTSGLRNQYNILIARRNVGKAEEILNRQQAGIDLINEEYQTRFGGLSRYG